MRQRSRTSGTRPRITSGATICTSLGLMPDEAAEQPEGDGGKLVVGIGQHLHQRDAGAGQRADDDAGQHQHQDLVLAAQRARPACRPCATVREAGRRSPAPGCRAPAATAGCRARRRSPRRPTRRGCRATPADCGTASGSWRRPPPAPRRPASAASTRGRRIWNRTVSIGPDAAGRASRADDRRERRRPAPAG